MKKIINIVIKIIFILFCFFLIYIAYDVFHYQDHKYGLRTVEEKIRNRYIIGSNGKDRKICDNFLKYGCLEGNIISYKNDGVDIYIYYNPYDIYGDFSEGRIYYPVFGPYDNNVINKESQKPDLIKLNIGTGLREFYSSNNIDSINDNDKIIFNELLKGK